ncbi:MAG: UDP-2,4-diacetamido-2,4,6-trideoxy-beta-L-altropyranose hydrolase [Castellaniella sp.]|nr:UDP-2,4-diacetamido-2,4,6-trideoxy-beta-L-altropyranose hydrolase [Castellaniella sp.]
MRVVFRTDASLEIGTGHVMRCLTLADALVAGGATCQFICRAHPGNLADLIRQHGFTVHLLPLDGNWVLHDQSVPVHAAWLGADWQTDAEQSLHALRGMACDWLIVDHYALDKDWELALKPCSRRLMVIDDLADRVHVCDLLLDQNWHGSQTPCRYDAVLAPTVIRLLGPEYALLKSEYGQLRSLMPPRDGQVQRVLIFMGGSDPHNQTAKVLRALMVEELSGLTVDVVVGANHPDPLGLAALVSARHATILHRDLPSLAGLMARADLMISAGGATTWERMCLGLPGLVISIADNQIAIQRALAGDGYCKYLGVMCQVDMGVIIDAVRWAIRHQSELIQQSESCQKLVGGSGTIHVVKHIREISGYVFASLG